MMVVETVEVMVEEMEVVIRFPQDPSGIPEPEESLLDLSG